jgi:hypothetical protein
MKIQLSEVSIKLIGYARTGNFRLGSNAMTGMKLPVKAWR